MKLENLSWKALVLLDIVILAFLWSILGWLFGVSIMTVIALIIGSIAGILALLASVSVLDKIVDF